MIFSPPRTDRVTEKRGEIYSLTASKDAVGFCFFGSPLIVEKLKFKMNMAAVKRI